MRDVNRIDPFLTEVGNQWKRCPDLRFGQLVYNVLSKNGDPFYWEEDEFMEKMKAFMDTIAKE